MSIPVIENVAHKAFNSTLTLAITVSNNPYKCLYVWVITQTAGYATDCWLVSAGTHLTLLKQQKGTSTNYIQVWRLINPPTGSDTVQVTISGPGSSINLTAYSVTGVSQTTPERTMYSATNAGSAVASIAGIACQAGDLVVDGMGWVGSANTITPGTDQVQIWTEIVQALSYKNISGGASTTMTETMQYSAEWNMIAFAIVPMITARGRIVDYYVDVNDENFQFRDAMGRIVPPWAIRSDTWGMLLGVNMPSGGVAYNFAQDQTGSYFYIEQVSYNDSSGQASIVCTRGDLDKVALARAAAQSTG